MPSFDGFTGYKVASLSTTTPLGVSATFTSPWVNVENVVSIRMMVFTDVSGTLVTEHSNDAGATIFRSSNQPYEANRHEPLSFYPRGDWFRCQVVNSATAQTFLQLATDFLTTALTITQSPYSAALGRTSLAAQTRAAIYDFQVDEFASISAQNNDFSVAHRVNLIADNFRQVTPLDALLWTTVVVGTGTGAIANTRLELKTGVTANSAVKITSTIVGRAYSGISQQYRAGVQLLNAGDINCVKRWGAFNDSDGFFWELDGTSLFAVSRRLGVDTRTISTSWTSLPTFVLALGGSNTTFSITFFGNTAFFIIGGDVAHRMSGTVGGLSRTGTLNLPIRQEIFNKNGAAVDNTLIITGTSLYRFGPDQVSPRYKNIVGAATTVVKNDSGRLHRVIVSDGSGANTCTIFDNTAGSGSGVATINVNKLHGSIEFDLDLSIGLTVVTTGVDTNVTVIFD